MQAYLPIIISAIVIFTALMWWLLALGRVKSDAQPPEALTKAEPQPTIEPAAPKAVADLAKTMPAATEPVGLVDGKPKPKAKTPPKAKPAPKAKVEAPKAKAAPKPITAPAAKPKAAPKPKVEAPKVKATPAPKPKAAPVAKPKAAPVIAKAKPAPKPAAAAAPKPAAKRVIPDDLELLKGVGPKVKALLKDMGITSFEDVASWTAADVAEIDSKLGVFAGRISRDNWVDQAKLLSAGDVATFEKKYGALGSEVK